MSDSSVILTERRGNALWIFINREERRNAVNPDVLGGIQAALEAIRNDASVRVVVLTGKGGKAFCAGADLSRGTGVFTTGGDEPTTDFGRLARLMRTIGVPTIARINGDCVAAGMGLISMCDLAIAADHARFGLPEAKVGVFPYQVLVYLRHILQPRVVNELCLTGDLIDAREARAIGLVNQVVPAAELDGAVDKMITRLAAASPMAVKRGKYALHAMESMEFNEALAFTETQIAVASNAADAREGLAAFNERRKPSWHPEAVATAKPGAPS